MQALSGQVLDRGAAGRAGGWFESSEDVKGKWLFLKEVSLKQTIPKMDGALLCHSDPVAKESFIHK